MPTVPSLEAPSIQYQPGPQEKVSAQSSLDDFGGGQASKEMSAGVDAVAGAVKSVGDVIKQKADDAVAIDAYTKTMAYKQGLLYGTPQTDTNPATPGALNLHGKDALSLTNDYSQKFDDYTNTIMTGMTPDQQMLYGKIRAQQKEDLTGTLEKHTYSETQAYNDDVVKSGIAVNRDEAVLNYQDPQKIAQAIDMQQRLIRDNASKKGLPPEEVQQQLEAVTSDTHQAVINRLLANQQDVQAKAYFDAHKDQISGADATVLEKSLEEGNLRAQSQKFVDGMESKNLTPQQAIDQIKTIDDPKLRDAVNERYKQDDLEKKRLVADNQVQLYQGAYNTMTQAKSLDAIPPNVMRALTPSQQDSLKSSYKQLIEGVPPTTDPARYYAIDKQIASDPVAFQKRNLMEDQPFLAPNVFQKFADMQKDSQKGNSKTLDGYMSDKAVVDGVLTQNGIDPTAKPSNNTGKQAAQFRSMVDTQVQQLEAQTGKKASNEDIRNISNKLMINVVTDKGVFYDTTKHQFQLQPGEEAKDIVVPKADQAAIVQKLQKRGLPTDKDSINRIYLKGLNSGR